MAFSLTPATLYRAAGFLFRDGPVKTDLLG